jgi:hypothetical protein
MKFGWYVNRLKSMEPAELLHRLLEQRRRAASRRRDGGWLRYPAPRFRAVFPHMREAILAATPLQRQAIKAAADGVLAGRFAALGQAWPDRAPHDLFPTDLWHLDPVTGGLWPGSETYTFDIEFRDDGRHGSIKYVWEINRLHRLLPLAADALLNDNDRSLEAIETMIASWHAANPPFRGTAWNSGIEVSIRSINLIVMLALVGDRLKAETATQVGNILAASAYWLPRFPSKFSSANNHRIAELAGEFLIGMAVGEEPPSRDELLNEGEKQFLADGAGAEQTPTYAAFSAEFILLCGLAARQSGMPFPRAVTERLAAFADFIAWLGPEARGFGDNDEGRVLTLGDEPDYPMSVATAIDGFLECPGVVSLPDDIRPLLFGNPAAHRAVPVGLRTFLQGGLSVWRGRISGHDVSLTFDHGPLGYLSIAAHGHADALSITLNLDGEPVLVDPGTFTYGASGVWREWFRSTPAHNTLNIEGRSQSVSAGPFNWSRKANAVLVHSVPAPAWLLRAQHDGYQREFGVLHQRSVELASEGLVVTEQLLGGAHAAEIAFQLAAGLRAERDHNAVIVKRAGVPILSIVFPDEAIGIAAGGDSPGPGGWDSSRFGTKLPADRLVWHGKVGESGVRILLNPHYAREQDTLDQMDGAEARSVAPDQDCR